MIIVQGDADTKQHTWCKTDPLAMGGRPRATAVEAQRVRLPLRGVAAAAMHPNPTKSP